MIIAYSKLGFHFYSQLKIWHDFPISPVEASDPRLIELGRKNPNDPLVQLVISQLYVITPLSDTHYASTSSMSLPNKKDIEEGRTHEWHVYCVSDPWLDILHTLYNLLIKKGFFHKCGNWGLEIFVQSYSLWLSQYSHSSFPMMSHCH